MNWGLFIQELVARAIPYIGRKPSYLSPFILHLYQHYGCTTREEDDLLTIATEVEIVGSIRLKGEEGDWNS